MDRMPILGPTRGRSMKSVVDPGSIGRRSMIDWRSIQDWLEAQPGSNGRRFRTDPMSIHDRPGGYPGSFWDRRDQMEVRPRSTGGRSRIETMID